MRPSPLAPYAALGAPFGWLLLGDALTLLALMVGQVALPWWLASAGGAHDLALYGVVTSGFALLAMPALSPLGDRMAKRHLIQAAVLAFTLAAAAVAVLASTGRYNLQLLIALGAVPVLAMAALVPAISTFSTELVPPAALSQAMSLQQTARSLGRIVGPALGGALLGAAGTVAALWLHAGLLVCAAFTVRRLPLGAPLPRAAGSTWRGELMAGLRANWRIPIERGWIIVNFASWIFLFPAFTMLVPLKVQSLGLSGAWLGACEVGLSVGMLAGSLGGSAWLVRNFGRYASRVGAAAVQGLALALAGLTSSGPWMVAGFAVAGFMSAVMVLVGMTHRMLARPQAYRARMVAGAVSTTHLAGMIGPALAGVALLHASVASVFTAFGLIGAVAGLGLALVPGFRAFMALDHEAVADHYGRHYPQAFEGSLPAARPGGPAGA